jgi:hypothetical protein
VGDVGRAPGGRGGERRLEVRDGLVERPDVSARRPR